MGQDQATEQGTQLEGSAVAGSDEGVKKSHLPEIPVAEIAAISCQEDLLEVLRLHESWTRAVLDPHTEVATGRANLKGADLRGYDLSGVNLSGANLSGAEMSGCDLEGANLTVANLEKAKLAGANLRHSKLRRARMDGADLRGADLTGALLTGVDLSKVLVDPPAVAAAPHIEPPVAEATVKAKGDKAVRKQASLALDPELPPGVIL